MSLHCAPVNTPYASEGEIPVAQYMRMSTEHQRYSTENQAAAIASYAAAHGMRVVRTYEDSGKSGLSLKGRVALQALLKDVQNPSPEFQAILVYDVSRWGRFPDPDEAASYVHTCKRHGVPVIYCAESFSNDGSLSSTVMIGLKRSMAAEYSRELSDKVFKGACNIIRHGYRQGGCPGYGLRRQLMDEQQQSKGLLRRGEKKSIQTDRVILVPGPSDEIDTILRIYRLFIDQSMPERVIASILNREGTLNERGAPWTRATIHQVLANEKYIGHNVYNRTSFKLKLRHVHNPPESWIRKSHAFEAVVPLDLFRRAQDIIAARSAHWGDARMLDALREVLQKHGMLSGILIDEQENIPSSSAFRYRFGSLLRVYSLVGYSPKRDYAYLEINRALRLRHPETVQSVADGVAQQGGWLAPCEETGLHWLNGELLISLVIVRCRVTSGGSRRWRIRLDASLKPDLTVVVRMDSDNHRPYDYYVLPAIDFGRDGVVLADNNAFSLDAYRMDSLDEFFVLAGRVAL